MTKSLEETFELPPMKEALAAQALEVQDGTTPPPKPVEPPPKPPVPESSKILNAITVAEKIEHALATVTELDDSDGEMDAIAEEALESYAELKDLAMNMSDAHAGRMMEVAASMLKTSLEAKEAKINRKLKTIDLQLKKMRMDRLADQSGNAPESQGTELDRNEILKHIYIQREE